MKNGKWLQFLKILVLGVGIAGLLVSVGQQEPARGSTLTTVAIMTTADLQSAVAPYTVEYEGKQLSVGGLERISSAARKIRSQVDGALLLSSGDDLIPPLFSIFHGTPEMRGMSLAGYDIVTPGNHEFDIGAEAYKDALKSASFEVVSANLVIDDQELRDRILPSTVRKIADIKVGVFGMMTPDFLRVCSPGDSTTVDQDIIPVAQKAVDNLIKEQCDLIIGLTHIGVELDRQLARRVAGIDIIIAGLRITIDLSKPAFCAVYSERGISQLIHPGSRIVKTEVYRNGLWTPLDPSAIYKVLVNTWASSGGDGYYILLGEDISKENTTMFTTDILASYIQRHSPVSPEIEGRISFVDK